MPPGCSTHSLAVMTATPSRFGKCRALPVITGHPVHFGIVMVVNLALGMITPPFGVNLFAACTVARISLDQIVTRRIPFVLVVFACLMVITYVPVISIGLRDLVYAK